MWFKKKEIEIDKRKFDKIVELIIEYVKSNYTYRQIFKQLKAYGYSTEVINHAFYIASLKGGEKMVRDEDYDNEEQSEVEDDEDQDTKPDPKKGMRKPDKIGRIERPAEQKVDLDAVLQNHEMRIQNLEATLFRIRNV